MDSYYEGRLRCYEDSILGFYETGVVATCDYEDIWDSVNETSNVNQNIRTYPIPVINELFIEALDANISSKILKVEIFNIYGELISISKINEKRKVIDFSKFKSGLYFAVIHTNEQIINRKIIKTD